MFLFISITFYFLATWRAKQIAQRNSICLRNLTCIKHDKTNFESTNIPIKYIQLKPMLLYLCFYHTVLPLFLIVINFSIRYLYFIFSFIPFSTRRQKSNLLVFGFAFNCGFWCQLFFNWQPRRHKFKIIFTSSVVIITLKICYLHRQAVLMQFLSSLSSVLSIARQIVLINASFAMLLIRGKWINLKCITIYYI